MAAVESLVEKTALESPNPHDVTPLLDQTPVPSIHRMEEEGVAITWKNLEVTTDAGRPLLRNVNGIALPGMMTALMGASGAGKTTLLNTLLARNTKGLNIKGEILVNGQKIGKGVTEVSSYVQQEDIFVGTLTVGEHLYMQANMRLPNDWTAREKKERVDAVTRDMLLENSVGSRIGVPGVSKGISGGELKRLAFATEILADPPVLFADEPTTGLDSHMAMIVTKRMESLSGDQGKTIVCTIHQPASEIFELFDRILFLAGGRTAFFGTPPEAVSFFAKCGYGMADHTNPADHYIKQIAILPGYEEECKKKCTYICDRFAESALNKRMDDEMVEFSQKRPLEQINKVGWCTLFAMLAMRYGKDNLRKSSMIRAKLVQKVFMGLFIGLLYLQTNNRSQDGINNLKGVLFYFCSELTYSTIFAIQTYMPGDFPLLAREYHDGVYPVSAYMCAKIASYLMIFSIDGAVMITIAYWMVGLPSVGRFFLTLFICLLVEISAGSMGIAICSMAPSYAVAVSITGPLLTVLSLSGGLFTNVDAMPGWISWVQYISWFRYGYESLVVTQFVDPMYHSVPCNQTSCLNNGAEVIQSLHFSESNLHGNLFIMFVYSIIVYAMGYCALVWRVLASR
ncbi:hypothetical protein PFISCL1PPCAC_16311 [Pristionchus fissidentatus]|uniref:ABC transporter domain-containing protein n=1 Tax=Pristionchus fissidentatus TaxID=1538716 RepID=A0AAV5W565_9BILA|nr:hypothetical protein PFISCL1PPCAC_16311 [Pristionchus fissidentatus]